MEVHSQIIHCKATYKVTSFTFLVSFVYGFHTMVNQRPLWNTIIELNENVSLPWLILGDYNNVLKFDEKCNGADVTPYEIKNLANCCLKVGLTDVRSIGCFYTWTNGLVWNKIDRAMVNDFWVQNGAFVEANFLPSGCLSDHSPCIVSIYDRKLSKLKGALKELNFKHFGHISTRASEAKNDLEAPQLQLHNQPMNMHFQLLVAKLRKKTVGLCEAERSFYYQKAKYVFLKQSDKCTKFFHSIVKRNSSRNFIDTILKEDGRYTTSQDQVAMEFVNFYTSLLGKNCPTRPIEMDIVINGPLISLEQGNNLIRDISYEEIKDALFDIGDEKSPGLRPILGDVVDHAQAAFAKGRSVTENIHLAQEFLRDVLHGLQFPSRFVHWVMEYVTSTSYSIALNGTSHGFFKGRKGLRQGDPLSPFLFVLCIEYLSRLLKAATDDNDFNFHPKCGSQKITHLAFTDDLMLFATGDVMLNVLKSNLFTAGIHGQLLEDILGLTSKIELIRRFFKESNNICLPKEEGGLGLKDLKSWNLALLAKCLWNIHNKKDTLWIRWVHQIYLSGTCIWEVCPRNDHSPLFKKLLEIRDILLVKDAAQQFLTNGQ
ncbi:uncharacterized protein LOC111392262 [Olea europaea var. sylvestris]|uniref:uncharacterized protein LOC111392262 n=1 Tax=Olea europaea var. sylvestris TaxID=158386 RepID=UPI000C1CE500|nr:uncharacterized protein LOC111392262 [Olea europaea var. sylvestris]